MDLYMYIGSVYMTRSARVVVTITKYYNYVRVNITLQSIAFH